MINITDKINIKKPYLLLLPVLIIIIVLLIMGLRSCGSSETAAERKDRPKYEINSARVKQGEYSLTEEEVDVLKDFLALDTYYFAGSRYYDTMTEIRDSIFTQDAEYTQDFEERSTYVANLLEDEVYLDGTVTAKVISVTDNEDSKNVEILVLHSLSCGKPPEYKISGKRIFQLTYTLELMEVDGVVQIKALTPNQDNPF